MLFFGQFPCLAVGATALGRVYGERLLNVSKRQKLMDLERVKGIESKGPSLPAFHKADVSYHIEAVYRTTPKKAILSEATKSGQIFQEFSGIIHSPSPSNSQQSKLVSGHQCSWHPCHQVSPVIPTLNSANHREPVFSKEWWRWSPSQSMEPPTLFCQTLYRIGASRFLNVPGGMSVICDGARGPSLLSRMVL